MELDLLHVNWSGYLSSLLVVVQILLSQLLNWLLPRSSVLLFSGCLDESVKKIYFAG